LIFLKKESQNDDRTCDNINNIMCNGCSNIFK
jgi:hypothetical protein